MNRDILNELARLGGKAGNEQTKESRAEYYDYVKKNIQAIQGLGWQVIITATDLTPERLNEDRDFCRMIYDRIEDLRPHLGLAATFRVNMFETICQTILLIDDKRRHINCINLQSKKAEGKGIKKEAFYCGKGNCMINIDDEVDCKDHQLAEDCNHCGYDAKTEAVRIDATSGTIPPEEKQDKLQADYTTAETIKGLGVIAKEANKFNGSEKA